MISRRSAAFALAMGLVVLPNRAIAQRDERLSADLSSAAGYANNPFAIAGGDTGSALLSIGIAPRLEITTERSALELSGVVDIQQYTRRYGLNDSYSGSLDHRLRAGERVRLHTRLDLSSAVQGAFSNSVLVAGAPIGGINAGGNLGTGPGSGPVVDAGLPNVGSSIGFVPSSDVSLFGLRNRRRFARLGGDVSVGVSARDDFIVGASAEAARFGSLPQFGDYEAFSVSLGYSHRMTGQLAVGLRGSTSSFDYGSNGGTIRVYPVEATAAGQLSERWTVDGALGVTIVDTDSIGSTRRTSLSGDIALCRRGRLSTLCARGARRVSPTGLVGAQYVATASVDWARRLSERENLTLGVSYSDVGGDRRPLGTVFRSLNEVAQALVTYDRRISQRLRAVASTNYRLLIARGTGQPDDFGGRVGLAYRLGDPR